MADSPLNPRHQKFVDEYILTGCGSEAYRRAGFYGRTAHVVSNNANRLMARDGIREAIARRQQQIESDGLLTLLAKKEVLCEIALANQTTDPMVAIRAIAELNRMEGHYAPKPLHTNTGHVTFIQQIGSPNEEHVVEADVVVDVVEVVE